MAYVYYDDGSTFDDFEGSKNGYEFNCRLNPGTYQKLIDIAHNEGLRTFDISRVINYVIDKHEKK